MENSAAGNPAAATHQDSGQAPEPATQAVVNASLAKAKERVSRTPAQMRAWILGEIDKAIEQAPAEFDAFRSTQAIEMKPKRLSVVATDAEGKPRIRLTAVRRDGDLPGWSVTHFVADDPSVPIGQTQVVPLGRDRGDAVNALQRMAWREVDPASRMRTFDVPGDGVFKVVNTKERLQAFRKQVEKSPGFKAERAPDVREVNTEGSQRGSRTPTDAIADMVLAGDFQAALDYAAAKGVDLKSVKLPKFERQQLGEWLKLDRKPTSEAMADAAQQEDARVPVGAKEVPAEVQAEQAAQLRSDIKAERARGNDALADRMEAGAASGDDLTVGPQEATSDQLSAYDKVARRFGYRIQDDGAIMRPDGAPANATLSVRGGAMTVRNGDGKVLFRSTASTGNTAEFLEKLWGAKMLPRFAPLEPSSPMRPLGLDTTDGEIDPGTLPQNAIVQDSKNHLFVVQHARHRSVVAFPYTRGEKPVVSSETSRRFDDLGGEGTSPLWYTGFTLDYGTLQERETPVGTPAAKSATTKPADLQDFGQKIGGARKDVWTDFKAGLDAVPDDAIGAQPLSKVWPAPDYQALIDGGMNARVAAAIRALRDEVPSKPRASYKVKWWAERVKTLRDFARDIADGKITIEAFENGLGAVPALRDNVLGRIDLYEAVGHAKSLEGVRFGFHRYSLYHGKENVSLWVVNKDAKATSLSNWPTEIATGKTREEALANFKKVYPTLGEKAVAPSFDIWSERGKDGFFVGKKVGRNYATLAGPFATVKEARAYRLANDAELAERLQKFKEIPRERGDVNQPRVGEDMRGGADVTPQQFGDAFGFRGVEFGNYVEQKRRQQDLNDAYDALMDMAAVLGIPPKAISLNGQLGLAFGARGSGGKNAPMAHYERGKVVINLTKTKGAGSIGHEWWHALDNYFSRLRGHGDEMMTSARDVSLASRDASFVHQGEVRKEMIEAYGAVLKAIHQTALRARSAKLDARRTKEYWTTNVEMSARAFESYLISKLQDHDAANDYLANVVSPETWEAAAKLGFELEDSFPYPTAGEMPTIRAGFDHFFDTLETKPGENGNVIPFNRSVEAGTETSALPDAALAGVIDRVTAGWKGDSEAPVVVRRFADLPAAVVQAAREQGYDNSDPKDRINGVAYKGRIYLVHENIRSEAEAEEVLLHERMHQALRTSGNPHAGPLHDDLEQLYRALGGTMGVLNVAQRAGANVQGLRKQIAGAPSARRGTVAIDELLAYVEGRRAYESLPQRAVRALQEFVGRVRAWLRNNGYTALAARFGMRLDQAGITDVRGIIGMLRDAEVNARSDGAPQFLRVWHGTPHRGIEQTGFKLNKIGSGEGNQSFGWGIYFAGARGTATMYRDNLSRRGMDRVSVNGRPLDDQVGFVATAARNIMATQPRNATEFALAREQAEEDLQARARHAATQGREAEATEAREAAKQLRAIRANQLEVAPTSDGQVYSAEIPSDSKLLDWDKPLSEQPPDVRAALDREGLIQTRAQQQREQELLRITMPTGTFDDLLSDQTDAQRSADQELQQPKKWVARDNETGQALYRQLTKSKGNEEAASNYLRSIGIPGLRYLDGGSRSAGEGTHNYVVWDEKLLTPEAAQITPAFSRQVVDTPDAMSTSRSFMRSALDQVHATLSHPGKVSMWSKTVGSMRDLAERRPEFKPVYDTAQRFIDDVSMLANDAANMAPRILPRIDSWRDLGKHAVKAADSKAVAKPIFDGTLLWARDGGRSRDMARNADNGKAGKWPISW